MRKRKILDAQYAYSRGMWRIGRHSVYLWVKGSGDPGVTVYMCDAVEQNGDVAYFLSLGHKAPRYAKKKHR
jgi:hypothetical protein